MAGEIVGTLGPIPASEEGQYGMEGYPDGARIGQDGQEPVYQNKLA